ncbi:hypothetical protein O9Z70_11935 [Devosia sp. YIM 151766]|nr:hypothetical protein [Devosia sp. YIM 151766]WIY52171.1 hypothetical protein O9Z70_11935 [Devosia sp. YIM 151766]
MSGIDILDNNGKAELISSASLAPALAQPLSLILRIIGRISLFLE